MKNRNHALDFLKFYFIFFVVLFHFYEQTYEHFGKGWMAVDTFAIISGLFLFQTINKKGELSDPYIYIYIYGLSGFSRTF